MGFVDRRRGWSGYVYIDLKIADTRIDGESNTMVDNVRKSQDLDPHSLDEVRR